MDIKGVVRNVIPFPTKGKAESASAASEARTKTDASAEREGNGQSADQERKRRTFTPEESLEVVKYLEELAGVKDNGLRVRLDCKDGITNIYIEDRDGKTVRRIPESEFEGLMANKQKKSGHLLNKAL